MTGVEASSPGAAPAPGDVLVGTIAGYGCVVTVNSPPPDGWLLCDGSAVSRSRYADLFDVIGTLHGSGDGVKTFNLPDHRGRFQRGVDDGTGNDPDANSRLAPNVGGATGDMVGSIQAPATGVPATDRTAFTTDDRGDHWHSVQHLPTDNSWYKLAGGHYAKWNPDSPDSGESGEHTHVVNGGGDRDTCPVNVYVNHIIYCGTGAK